VWDARSSLVAEWFWALLVRPPEDIPARRAFYDASPGLAERIASFWEDDSREFIELMVLAKRADCLWDLDQAHLLNSLRAVVGSGVGAETLDSEEPEIAELMRRRLLRLQREPELAAAWLGLIGEVAETFAPHWEAHGRLAVELAVRAQRAVAARAADWPELWRDPGCQWGALVPELGQRTVAAGGEVVLLPSWLARKSFLLSFGDLVLVGCGVGDQPLPSDATRAAARRLRALADPTRLAVMEQLAVRPRGVGELARDLQMAQPTISNHVRLLREAGVIRDGVRPQHRQLGVDADGVASLLDEVRALILGFTP
jgi:DNA-binding transcriptional ArsR family regulator